MAALRNFLNLQIITVSEPVLACLAGVWLLMVLMGIWSVKSTSMSGTARFVWIVMIFGLPLIGLGTYCARCLVGADWEFIRQFGFFNKPQTLAKVQSRS